MIAHSKDEPQFLLNRAVGSERLLGITQSISGAAAFAVLFAMESRPERWGIERIASEFMTYGLTGVPHLFFAEMLMRRRFWAAIAGILLA